MRPYSVVLFDIDGTLVDSADAVVDAILYTCGRMGLPEPPAEDLRRYVGPPLWDTFAEFGLDEQGVDQAVQVYREYYRNIFLDPPLFEGVRQLLELLDAEGLGLATATSKYVLVARKQMEFLGVAPLLDVIAGAQVGPHSKATVVRDALAQLDAAGCDMSRPVLVGDRCFDIEGAREVGIPVIGVEWGYAQGKELNAADLVVSTPGELADILLGR